MKQNFAACALALAGAVCASPEKVHEDSLHSARLAKRGINADGNFNMCEYHRTTTTPQLHNCFAEKSQHFSISMMSMPIWTNSRRLELIAPTLRVDVMVVTLV